MNISKTLFKLLTRCHNTPALYNMYINHGFHDVKEINGLDLEKINNVQLKETSYTKENYPEITLNHLPQEVLLMLKRIYAGVKSEFTSLTQYMYQHYIVWSNPKLNNLSEIIFLSE